MKQESLEKFTEKEANLRTLRIARRMEGAK
ncbi:hypothetical protein ES705_37956 [subsurface metagenome]